MLHGARFIWRQRVSIYKYFPRIPKYFQSTEKCVVSLYQHDQSQKMLIRALGMERYEQGDLRDLRTVISVILLRVKEDSYKCEIIDSSTLPAT